MVVAMGANRLTASEPDSSRTSRDDDCAHLLI
jgi:hypothetical protein